MTNKDNTQLIKPVEEPIESLIIINKVDSVGEPVVFDDDLNNIETNM